MEGKYLEVHYIIFPIYHRLENNVSKKSKI
jgi:hypothetical protein